VCSRPRRVLIPSGTAIAGRWKQQDEPVLRRTPVPAAGSTAGGRGGEHPRTKNKRKPHAANGEWKMRMGNCTPCWMMLRPPGLWGAVGDWGYETPEWGIAGGGDL
jgi:hypothetical protein